MNRNKSSDSRLLNRLLKGVLPWDHYLEKSGDLEEAYRSLQEERGRIRAGIWYARQVLLTVKLFVFESVYWRTVMLGNYFKVALRNILKHKGFSIINLFGLAVGMAVCILILLWVWDETSYDKFHENIDELYRVVEHQNYTSGSMFPVAVTPDMIGPALKDDYPEVLEFTRLRIFRNVLVKYQDKSLFEDGICFADPAFLDMFNFPLLEGNKDTVLPGIESIVLSERMVKKYFRNEDPLGRTITLFSGIDMVVSGVMKDIPQNSHLQFDFLGHFDFIRKKFGWSGGWHNNNYYTYVQLQKNSDVEKLGAEVFEYFQKIGQQSGTKFLLQPVKDIHLRSYFAIDIYGASQGRSIYVYVFSVVALIVILIACINFMNLSTARSATRAKEVGMRKVVGGRRPDIIRQFFGESILFASLAAVAAAVLVQVFLPAFNNLTGKSLAFSLFSDVKILLFFIGIVLITGVISGIYPALYISAFQPVKVLKGGSASGFRSSFLRKALVVLQFSLSIIFIAGTLIVSSQLNYVRNRSLGFNQEHVILFTMEGYLGDRYQAFKDELLQSPGIRGVTKSSDRLTYTVHSTGAFRWEGRNPDDHILVHQFSIGHDYVKTLGMEIVAGRDLSREFPSDAKSAYLINETLAELLGYEDPIGKAVTLYNRKGAIVGVIKDFNYKSAHKKIEPLILRIDPRLDWFVYVRIEGGDVPGSLAAIEEIYKKHVPELPFTFTFLDESLNSLYQSDRRTGRLFSYFTILAIFISCLGLFALASFMIEQRTKEIGVRKVMGANLPRITVLLTRDFLKWIVAANVIALPTAYFVMQVWLNNFAYRTAISIWTFVLAASFALAIALATIGYQSIKAARANPADFLRYE
jgi:ABC-type antimicrobial peptide transport system permease subunit